MDEKLQEKVCYLFTSALGCIKMCLPEMYHLLYDFDANFTEEEQEIIVNLADNSGYFEDGVKALKKFEEEE